MGMFNIFNITGSGMSAQSVRLNATASNLANAETVSSSTGETYRARHPVFSTALDEAMGGDGSKLGGVRVDGIVESQAPLQQKYAPDHPQADENGNIYMPNVNPVEEMANMMSASRSYQTQVEVANTAKQLMMKTLTLGK